MKNNAIIFAKREILFKECEKVRKKNIQTGILNTSKHSVKLIAFN